MHIGLFMAIVSVFSACRSSEQPASLVPESPSNAPDYFCTWSVQGYSVNYTGTEPTRAAIDEAHLFGDASCEGWAYFFPKIRSDLFFVMDDSWDIPRQVNTGNNEYLGLAELDASRFPSFTGTPQERLKQLTERMKAIGWKGLGGWICAQESVVDSLYHVPEAYWSRKLKAAGDAGFSYWKVDWGKNDRVKEWRQMLTRLGHLYAPQLWIEHAMVNEYITFSDVFRTYDVESITSAATTIDRIARLLPYQAEEGAKGVINCEDEPYIAVGLGCAIGIMRYPFDGALPNGKPDHVFPAVGRNLKKRMDEITRAVRWHRIAEPFGVCGDARIDTFRLTDRWVFRSGESWVNHADGEILSVQAPARISRGMELPEISNLHEETQPFVLASCYPNGAVAVVTLDRTAGRESFLQRETVHITVKDFNVPIGIFGDYETLVIEGKQAPATNAKVYMQDLAGDTPVEVTDKIKVEGNRVTVSGDLIREIGTMAGTSGDLSAPGLVMVFIP